MAVEAAEGTDIETLADLLRDGRGAPRPLGEDLCTARLLGLASALLPRASERQRSGGGRRRRFYVGEVLDLLL